MDVFNNFKKFFENAGWDKLFLSVMPGFCAIIATNQVFTNNLLNSFLMFLGIICLQSSIKIFDDFIDWVDGKPQQRQQLEQTGMRGRFDKCIYFYENSPRKYFYFSLLLFLYFLFTIVYISYSQKSILIFIPAIFIPILGCINYSNKTKPIIEKFGTEFVIAFLCSFINMFLIFYAGTKCIIPQIAISAFIVFFFVFNICYISSLLNLKVDIMTEKTTFAVFIQNQAARIWFLIFFSLFPFILTYLAISFNIFPNITYLTFLLIPHTLWLIYLVVLYEKEPHKQIKWHFLMGPNKYKIQDEQNSLSWYNARYKLARNIFCVYMIILAVIYVL